MNIEKLVTAHRRYPVELDTGGWGAINRGLHPKLFFKELYAGA